MELWDRFWHLFDINRLVEVGVREERDFFIDVLREYRERFKKSEPKLAEKIVELAYKSFLEDFKSMVEKTKDAIGQLEYEKIIYDPEEE